MNIQPTELPKHIKETLELYESKYDTLIYQQDVSGASAKCVPSDGCNTCRYCEKSSPAVHFKTDCHALLEALGNRHLFAEDECDSCNKLFGIGGGIEDHFGKWSLPYRVMSCVRGKKGYPTIKRPHLGWRIEASATGFSISMTSDHQIASINEEGKRLLIDELPRDPFIPIAVYKAFVRMAISLMPRDELANFRPAISWLMQKDHAIEIDNVCSKILQSFIPQNAPPDTVAAALARRHTNELNLPYMVFMLLFSNYIFQVFIPSPKSLQNHDFTATIFPTLYGPDPANPITPLVVDLCGRETVKNEMVPFPYHFGYQSVQGHHTSVHESIATRAYYIWQAGGSILGNDESDWLLAESEITSK